MSKIRACEKQVYDVTKFDLPLSCPMKNMRLWDAHPRVFLPIEKTGKATCPYCDAEFILKDV
ncbi:zinc-finger domain-containing protein [Gammaproteobacteria bacterium]|nr:zinc-finger domain-containing protein [Gammaproteobacteria bacterium]